MKLTTIAMTLAFVAGTAGLSGAASAQDHQPNDGRVVHTEQVRHDEVRHDETRRDDHARRDDHRRGWGHHQRCRTVWRHHHRIRRCW